MTIVRTGQKPCSTMWLPHTHVRKLLGSMPVSGHKKAGIMSKACTVGTKCKYQQSMIGWDRSRMWQMMYQALVIFSTAIVAVSYVL